MNKILSLFVLVFIFSCSDDEPQKLTNQPLASICPENNLGITESAKAPFFQNEYIDPADNTWFWQKSNDTLRVFSHQVGIDTSVTTEYSFLTTNGQCLVPIKVRIRDTEDEMPFGESNVPVISEYPMLSEIQYYSATSLVGNFTMQTNSENISKAVWVEFEAMNERANYDAEIMR